MIPLTWSDWIPLEADLAAYREHIANAPGFYQIRAVGQESLVYIGQTGRSLRLRTRSELAKQVIRPLESPPWNDPHTAAPLLWAFRHENGMAFELSVAAIDLPVQLRQSYEDVLLYLHRQHFGHSTLCNHGRRHPWWSRASNRKQGRPTSRLDAPIDYPSLPPASGISDSLSAHWLGLEWTEFSPLHSKGHRMPGVYRICSEGQLLYVGESRQLASRLAAHARDQRFKDCQVSCHFMPDALPHQLKERETDLIGAYVLQMSKPPLFQYSPEQED